MTYRRLEKSNLDLLNKDGSFLDIFLHLAELKNTLRTGWIKYHKMDKKFGESVADHSFVTASLGYFMAKELKLNLDYDRLLKMLLFHELGEIYLGDVVSYENRDLSKTEKKEKEREALNKFLSFLSENLRNEILEMMIDFEDSQSEEAKFAKSMDQLEAAFQAWLYKKQNLVGHSVGEFKDYAISVAKKNEQKELLEILESLKLKN